jgi:hypothetical protein
MMSMAAHPRRNHRARWRSGMSLATPASMKVKAGPMRDCVAEQRPGVAESPIGVRVLNLPAAAGPFS